MFGARTIDRRVFCRCGFVLLCVLPTALILLWSLYRATPLYSHVERLRWQTVLSRELGLAVSINGVANPKPGTIIFSGLQLADPETGQEIATAATVEATDTPRGVVLIVSQLELHADRLGRLWETLNDRLLRTTQPSNVVGELLAPSVILHTSNSSQEEREAAKISDLRARIEPETEGLQLAIEFRWSDGVTSEPTRIHIVRRRSQAIPTTRWELRSGSVPLPCRMLRDVCPSLASLGDDCFFDGLVWGEQTPSGWQGDLNGHLTNIDLGLLVSDHIAHRIDGKADIVLRRALFRDGRLIDAAGSLRSGPGQISQSFLVAAVDELRLRLVNVIDQPVLPYERLALDFSIDSDGLMISGHCDQHGAVLVGDNGPVLLEPADHELAPVVALVRALVPDGRAQAPLAKETDLLLRILPIPAFSEGASSALVPSLTPPR